MFDPLINLINGFVSYLSVAQGKLIPMGLNLVGSIFLMLLIWKTLFTVLSGGSGRKILAESIHLMAVCSIAVFLITNIGMVGQVVNDTSSNIINAVSDSNFQIGPTTSAGELAIRVISPMMDAAINTWNMSSKVESTPTECKALPDKSNVTIDGKTGREIVKCPETQGLLAGLKDISLFLAILPSMFITMILKLLAMFTLVLAAMIVMGHIVISQLMIFIAIILGPILIPFLIWDAMSFLFDGWLKFFIKATFHKIVGIILLGAISGGINGGLLQFNATKSASYGEAYFADLVGAFIMLGVAVLTVMLASQIPNWADGLLGGMSRSGVSLNPGAPAAAGKVAGTTGKAISGGTKTLATKAAGAAKDAIAKVRAPTPPAPAPFPSLNTGSGSSAKSTSKATPP